MRDRIQKTPDFAAALTAKTGSLIIPKWWLGLLCWLLIACDATGMLPSASTATLSATAAPTLTPTVTLTPSPTPTPTPRVLTVCMGAEPESLYFYDATSYAAQLILAALYDGPIDTVNYAYQPVILETLPSLANGDARIETVDVQAGDRVVAADGKVVTLEEGVIVYPAACRAADCAVPFAGEPLALDRMQVMFRLLPDLYWSDGTPLTALDSVYSFALASDPDTVKGKWLELRTSSYVAQDPVTVVWTGLPGYVDAAYMTNFWTPLPAHAWDGIAVTDLPTARAAAREPLGYGPYQVENWVNGRLIRMRPNAHYFRTTEHAPLFDELIFRFIAPDTALQALDTGLCDVLTRELYPEREWASLQALEADNRLQITAISGVVWEYLTFNVAPPPDYDTDFFFATAQTRRAVAACIDRQRIVDTVTHGFGVVADSYLAPEHPLYATTAVARHPFDPVWGQAQLEAVGWRDADGDGIREAHGVTGTVEGTPFQVAYVTADTTARLQVARVISENLATCGIAADVITHSLAALYAPGPDAPLSGRHFDMVAFAWLTGVQPPCELYATAAIPSDANFWDGENFSGYANPVYDAACASAVAALPGEAAYVTAHRDALRMFTEDLPALPLYQRPYIYATRPDLRGFQPDPLMPETWNIEDWWVE